MIQTDQKTLPEKLREYRQKMLWGKLAFCKATGINFHSYTHVEPTDKRLTPRPIGLKIFKQLAKHFANDVEMTKALLEYAGLNPSQLHRMFDAETWYLLPKLPESNRLIQFIFKGSDTEAQAVDTFDMATGIFANGELWRFQGAWWPRDSMDGIDIDKIYTWRYLDKGFVPSEPSGVTDGGKNE